MDRARRGMRSCLLTLSYLDTTAVINSTNSKFYTASSSSILWFGAHKNELISLFGRSDILSQTIFLSDSSNRSLKRSCLMSSVSNVKDVSLFFTHLKQFLTFTKSLFTMYSHRSELKEPQRPLQEMANLTCFDIQSSLQVKSLLWYLRCIISSCPLV